MINDDDLPPLASPLPTVLAGLDDPSAAIFHNFVARVRRMEQDHLTLSTSHRAGFEVFFDRAATHGEEAAREIYPDHALHVDKVYASALALSAARRLIHEHFLTACTSKMREIARGQAGRSDAPEVLYAEAFESFRLWRANVLDGKDVEMVCLLRARTQYAGKNPGLFEQLFVTWAKDAFVDMKTALIGALRTQILSVGMVNYPVV